jgi:ABC-type glutathione transport system ATPase component
MEVLSAMSDTLTIMSDGKDVLTGPPGTIFSQPELTTKYGLEPPALFQVGNTLRQHGFPLSLQIRDGASLVAGITNLLA